MYLATSVDSQPFVRPMSLLLHDEKLWCCSPGARSKVKQIRKNNSIEFALLAFHSDQYHNIRGTGKAIEITEQATRSELAQAIPFFSEYWRTPEDPLFILYRLDIDTFEYHPPGGKRYFIIDQQTQTSTEFEKHFRVNS